MASTRRPDSSVGLRAKSAKASVGMTGNLEQNGKNRFNLKLELRLSTVAAFRAPFGARRIRRRGVDDALGVEDDAVVAMGGVAADAAVGDVGGDIGRGA